MTVLELQKDPIYAFGGLLGATLTSPKTTAWRPMALQYAVTAVLTAEYGARSFVPTKEVTAGEHKALATLIMNTANQSGWATTEGYHWEPVFTLAEATRDLGRRGVKVGAAAPAQIVTAPSPAPTATVTPTPLTPYQPVTYSPRTPIAVTPAPTVTATTAPELPSSRRMPVSPTLLYHVPDPGLQEEHYTIEHTTRRTSPDALRIPGQMAMQRTYALQWAITEVLKDEGMDPQPFSTRINLSSAKHFALSARIAKTANEPGWVTYAEYVWTPPFTVAEAQKELTNRGYWIESDTAERREPFDLSPAQEPMIVSPEAAPSPQLAPSQTYEPREYQRFAIPAQGPALQVEPTEPLWDPSQVSPTTPPTATPYNLMPSQQQEQTVIIHREEPTFAPAVAQDPSMPQALMTAPSLFQQEQPFFPAPELPLPPRKEAEAEAGGKAWIWALALAVVIVGSETNGAEKRRTKNAA